MRPAEYFAIGASTDPASWRHYALAMDYYTHFTSPIRRYADIIVHRVLQAVWIVVLSCLCLRLLLVPGPEGFSLPFQVVSYLFSRQYRNTGRA